MSIEDLASCGRTVATAEHWSIGRAAMEGPRTAVRAVLYFLLAATFFTSAAALVGRLRRWCGANAIAGIANARRRRIRCHMDGQTSSDDGDDESRGFVKGPREISYLRELSSVP